MSEAELSVRAEAPVSGAGARAAPPAAERAVRLFQESWRYLAVSVFALGVDFGLLVALTELCRLHYLLSSSISYCAGAVVHYGLCVRLVFRVRRLADRRAEFAGFIATGLVGLAVTQAVLWLCVDRANLNYAVGKAAATMVSFVLIFALRKALLFTAPKPRRYVA